MRRNMLLFTCIALLFGMGERSLFAGNLERQTSIDYLAFLSDRIEGNEVYVMQANGTGVQEVTSVSFDLGDVLYADVSPDGSVVAFVTASAPGIFLVNIDGTNIRYLVQELGLFGEPAWSPDGSKVAFSSMKDGNDEIYVVNSDGTNQLRLTSNSDSDRAPTWSPDGTKIAFESDREGSPSIFVMNSDGTGQTRITPTDAYYGFADWSPLGNKIAFVSDKEGTWTIYVMDVDGANIVQLTSEIGGNWRPKWSPDGSRIAFSSHRDGNTEIYLMNADGSSQIRLTNNDSIDLMVSWLQFEDVSTLTPTWTATTTPTPTYTNTSLPATNTPTATNTPGGSPTFYRAVNLNGSALTIDGNGWEADGTSNFSTNGYTACFPSITLIPSTDTNRDTMLRCIRWNQHLALNMSSMPSGSYDVYIYVMEDDWTQTFGITLEGQTAASNLESGDAGEWTKFGPWRVTVSDGTLNLVTTGDGWINISGFEVWSAGGGSATSTPTNTPATPTNTPTRTNTPTATPTVTVTNTPGGSPTFYRAVNLNGSALTIDGNGWESDGTSNFSTNGYTACFPSITLVPSTDTNRAAMLRCIRWNQHLALNMSSMPSGSYDVYIYVMEDDWTQTFGITLEGQTAASNLESGDAGEWTKFGPWRVTISDGTLNLATTGDGWINISGFEVWSAGS